MKTGIFTVEHLSRDESDSTPRLLNEKDVAHVGADDLRVVLSRLRLSEKHSSENIGYIYARLETLRSLLTTDVNALIDLSVDVKNLQTPIFGEPPESLWVGTTYHQAGHTTFRYCGQCKHASSWSAKGVTCRFDNYTMDAGAPYESPCRVIVWSKSVIQQRLDEMECEVEREKARRNAIRQNIAFLQSRLPKAPKKPVEYESRRSYFRYGDRVRVYTYSVVFGGNQNKWVPATVVAGSRGDSKVCVVCDEPLVRTRSASDDSVPRHWSKYAWAVPQKSPFILHEWEFAYFREREEELARWVGVEWQWYMHDDASGKYYSPERSVYLASVQNSRKHLKPQKNGRLMSAEEARTLLGFVEYPTEPVAVCHAYYALKMLGDEPELRRAKDTLLARIYGTESVGG